MTTIMPHTQGEPPEENGEEGAEGYAALSRDELKAELESRGLDSTGRAKADLIARLEEADGQA